MTENFVTLLWLGPVWKTHFSYKPSTKCLEFSFYISLLINYFCCLENFCSIRLCLQFFSIDLLFLSNVYCLQWHLKVVLIQHKCSLFIQLHCPHLCPPNFLGFFYYYHQLQDQLYQCQPLSPIDLLIKKLCIQFISVWKFRKSSWHNIGFTIYGFDLQAPSINVIH